MNPVDTVESAVQKFIFDFLDRFGASLTIVAVILILMIKVIPKFAEVIPELARVMIDKYRAETETIRDTQKAIIAMPGIFLEMKTAIIAELQRHQSEGDRRIEEKVDRLSRRVANSEPDSEPPPARSSHLSKPG